MSLAELNAISLRELGRIRVEGSAAHAFSPDRRFLALIREKLQIIDLERLEVAFERRLAHASYRVLWPNRRQIVAFSDIGSAGGRQSFVTVVDPVARQTVHDHAIGAERLVALRSIGGRAVLLTATTERWSDIGGPLHLITVRANGSLRVQELPVRFGYDDWHVRVAGALPPHAAAAVRDSRNDLAARKGVSTEDVRVLSVVPYREPRVYALGHRTTLQAAGEYWEYSRHVVDGTLFRRQIGAAPAAPPNDLLVAPVGSLIARIAVLAPSREPIVRVITSPGFVATSSPGSAPTMSRASGLRGAWNAFALDSKRLAVAVTDGVVLVDLAKGPLRRIRTTCEIAAGHGRLLLFGKACGGIRAYRSDGRPAFRIAETHTIVTFKMRGRYGYLWTLRGRRETYWFSVIDLERGRRVTSREGSRGFSLLP